MTINELLQKVNKAIEAAEFDRERFSVKAAHAPDGMAINIHADTLFNYPEKGKWATSYQPIFLDDAIESPGLPERLPLLVSNLVEDLAEYAQKGTISHAAV